MPDPREPARGDWLPYARHTVRPEDVRAVAASLTSGWLAQGPEVERFERALAGRVGTRHAVAVANGTAALHVALLALGVGPGDEVLVPPLTFVATASAVRLCGATPVFADVEDRTLTLDPAGVARRVGPRTRGAIAVHYAGHPADTHALREALGPGRFLLEDACHALGATWRGRAAGALGDAGVFSFHPAKAITTGEGGAVVTDSGALAERARRAREHGLERRPEHRRGLGLPPELGAEERGAWVAEVHALAPNARLAEPAAALGRSQLAHLDEWLAERRALAAAYTAALAEEPALRLPREHPEAHSAWHLYPVRIRRDRVRGGRAAVFAALRAEGIGVQVHYVPVHLQPEVRKALGTVWGDHPVAEQAYLELLSLPLFPGLGTDGVARVVDALRRTLRELAV